MCNFIIVSLKYMKAKHNILIKFSTLVYLQNIGQNKNL